MARTDSFFEDSSRKRKRSLVSGQARGGDGQPSRGTSSRGGRGRGGSSSSLNKGKGRSRRRDDDEEDAGQQLRVNGNESGLSSDESDDKQEVLLENGEDFFDSEEEEAAAETPAQKRLRLAKQYLESLKAGQGKPAAAWRRLLLGNVAEIVVAIRWDPSRDARHRCSRA